MEPKVAVEIVTAADEIGPFGTGCGFVTSFGKTVAAAGVSSAAAQPDRSVAAERAAAPPRKWRRDSRKRRFGAGI
jgi:hypothetical protein